MGLKLSILIPSLVSRDETSKELINGLKNQIGCKNEIFIRQPNYTVEIFSGDEAEIILVVDNKQMTTGAKRNLLLETATGEYVSYIDDDDFVTDNYFELFKNASESNPDCISPCGWMTTNGTNKIDWQLSKNFENRTIKSPYFYFERKANHLCFIKRELALLVKFPNISNAEDKNYSENINQYLKTEVRIMEQIYHYKFSTLNKEY